MKLRWLVILSLAVSTLTACNNDSSCTKCNGLCVDLTTNSDHCGACGHACGTGESCKASECVLACPTSELQCGSTCVNPKTDHAYCGAQADCSGTDQGTPCTSSQACVNGVCVTCSEGATCVDSTNTCLEGKLNCTNGPVCQQLANAANGKQCGTDKVCAAGTCLDCVVDEVCTPATACKAGKRTCSSGPACVATTNLDAGTSCGTNSVCTSAGQCVACTAGASCAPTNGCHQGLMDCSHDPVCVDQLTPVHDGLACQGAGAYNYCTAGACTACANGNACVPANPCYKGTLNCNTAPPTCTATATKQPDGTSCDTGKSCIAGTCLTNDRVITVTSGDGQSAAVDAPLAATVNVHVVDGTGTAVPSTLLTITAAPGAYAAPATTDASGNAKISARVGRAPGAYAFSVSAPGVINSAAFSATATAAIAKSIFTVVNVTHTTGNSTVPGPATMSKLQSQVRGVVVKSDGTLYVSDFCAVYSVSPAGALAVVAGIPGTCASSGDGGKATDAKLYYAGALALDEAHGRLYIAEYQRVRLVDLSAGTISTYAGGNSAATAPDYGDGSSADQAYLSPVGINVAPNGDLYISDGLTARVRKVDFTSTVITRPWVGATSCPSEVAFASCGGAGNQCSLAWDSQGQLFLAGSVCIPGVGTVPGIIRAVSPTTFALVAGANSSTGSQSDGVVGASAYFPSTPQILFDQAGNLLALVTNSSKVRRIDAATSKVTTLVGTGTAGYLGDYVAATTAQLNYPYAFAIDVAGSIYIADDSNYALRAVYQLGDTVAPSAKMVNATGSGQSVSVDAPFSALMVTIQDASSAYVGGVGVTWKRQNLGSGIIGAPAPNNTLISRTGPSNGTSVMTGRVGLAPGDYAFTATYTDIHGTQATGSPATFTITAVAPPAGTIFTIDNVARTATVGGLPGPATFAQHGTAHGSVVASDGTMYLSMYCAVLKVTPAGEASVFAGTTCGAGGDEGLATAAKLNDPRGLALDEANGVLYIADTGNNLIRMITLADGIIHVFAGGGTGFSEGAAPTQVQFSQPQAVSVDHSGDVYITDINSNAIRVVRHAKGLIETWFTTTQNPPCTDSALQLHGLVADASDVLWVGTAGDAYISGYICGAETANTQVLGIVLRSANGTLTRIAGVNAGSASEDILATSASFPHISGMALSPNGDIAIATGSSNTVRLITKSNGRIHTIAGNGTSVASTAANDYVLGTLSPVNYPHRLSYTPTGHLIIGGYSDNCFREVW